MPVPRTAKRAGGFTLVELVTAASLMTVMMLGVVEIFGIITTTANEAEGIHFAQQQMRAFFDRLHADIRGMTREGYLIIRQGRLREQGDSYSYEPQPAADELGTGGAYACDTLAFVTVGPQRSQLRDPPVEANCAEVVYTNYVKTPNQVLQVPGVGGGTKYLTPRRGILARGVYLLDGDSRRGSGAPAQEDQSFWDWLCDLFSEANPPLTQNLAIQTVLRRAGGNYLTVWPWLEQRSASGFVTAPNMAGTLNRVMACCVSEFYVDVFDPEHTDNQWFRADDELYVWSKEFQADSWRQTWPRAIRVTVAVHDPGDTSEPPPGQSRFRGYAMQETYWLGDP